MQSQKLAPSLGLWTSISMVIGGIIGSGIFMKPAVMASQLGSPEALIAVWIGAGIITLFGALSNAEVAAMIPETGGQYIFFQKMYGDLVAFLYGWAGFAVFNTAGVASIAYILGIYTEYFVQLPRFGPAVEHSIYLHVPFIGTFYPVENIGVKTVTIVVVVVLTWINYRSTRSAGNLQVVLTTIKIISILFLVLGLLFSSAGSAKHFVRDPDLIIPTGWAMVTAVIGAMSGAFWGYDGWNNITFVAGEIRNPQINIPKALMVGILSCIGIYTLMTLSYLYILPIDVMSRSGMVATDAAVVVMGTFGAGFIAMMVIFSTMGTTNGNILATARISFAMAQENRFFKSAGVIHPKFKTPGNALLIHGVWTSLLVLTGSFDMLTDMLIFVSWLFYGLSAFGIFILRRKMPDAPRPYRIWGYPFIPAAFVGFTLFFLVVTLCNDIVNYRSGHTALINSLFGLLLTASGLPLYWYFRRREKAQ